jgi:hypothetical protein
VVLAAVVPPAAVVPLASLAPLLSLVVPVPLEATTAPVSLTPLAALAGLAALAAAVVLWAYSAAIRLCMKACMAAEGSVLEVVVDEPDDEELVDEVPDVALALEVLAPVAPICDSACTMELINPPPGGGGGGSPRAELESEVLVLPGCVLLLVLLVEDSCASQLFRLETPLMVI